MKISTIILPDDLEQIKRVSQGAFSNTPDSSLEEWFSFEEMSKAINEGRGICLKAVNESGDITGVIYAQQENPINGKEGKEKWVIILTAVSPTESGKGIGTQLLRGIEDKAVENRLDDGGAFTYEVVDALTEDGRFKGTKIVHGFNVSHCIELCKSGKIRLVIFDWIDPDEREILNIQGPRDLTYSMFYGNNEGTLSLDDDSWQINLADGRMLSEEDMKKAIQEIDVRAKWMELVQKECAKVGTKAPDYLIVRSRPRLDEIAQTVADALGRPRIEV